MAEFDLPAVIDTILRVNGASKLYYVGHSQGTTVLFAKLARDPSFSSKIARFFALAPITTSMHMKGPMSELHNLRHFLQTTEEIFGGQEYAPATQMFGDFVSKWICPFAHLAESCESILALMGGPSGKGVFNVTRSLVYLAHYPGTSSIRNFVHWGQMIRRNETSMYDFGSDTKNKMHYGQTTPPVYNFTDIRDVAIHLFYSENDLLAPAQDVENYMLAKQLSPDVVKEIVKVPGYAHYDFVYAMTLKREIFDKIIGVISPVAFGMAMSLLILCFLFHGAFSADPEVNMSVEEIITYWKYPFEEFTARTNDGNDLTLFRIMHGRRGNSTCSPGHPILLAHGLGASADHWLMNPPASNPAFILADSGLDVWLVNFRGAKYSKDRQSSQWESSDYWDFSWDEMAEFDLPAAVDTILRVNGAARVYYVGHSQIARLFALAPITSAKYLQGPMSALYYIREMLQKSNDILGGQEYMPPTQYIAFMLADWICPISMFGSACENAIAQLGGYSGEGIFNRTRAPVYLSHYAGTSSKRNFAHWGQMIWSNDTRMYDFGSTKRNFVNYGQPTPPLYDFTAIRNVSIHLFYSSNDIIATAEDVENEMLVKHLRPDVVKGTTKIPGYAHMDFLSGTTVKEEIYDKIIEAIRNDGTISRGC